MQPLVSIITPTFQRHHLLNEILSCVLSQDYPNIEWIVLDDSPVPFNGFRDLVSQNIHYIHSANRISLGEKRNQLIEKARGEIIVQFDDDDYYSPVYVTLMTRALTESGADLMNLRGWFFYNYNAEFFGYWDLMKKEGIHFVVDLDWSEQTERCVFFGSNNNAALKDNHLGYGFSYVFKRDVFRKIRFPALDMGEDTTFVVNAMKYFKVAGFKDTKGIVLHCLHSQSTSKCFPQYRIPTAILGNFFPLFNAAIRKNR